KTAYAMDDAHREKLLEKEFAGRGKIDISRFKGLGEMPVQQLRETAMSVETRTLLRVTVPLRHTDDEKREARDTEELVEQLMGKKPELRLAFIQEHAKELEDGLIDV
ncbi:MAG: DNA topoisomerase IV subunit B, partial [Rhodospirillaceae bacterium]|nr:DNA topoisomerase IV subunit B [Rhodospirillaceae bacterium]